MDEAVKDRLVARFRAYLDSAELPGDGGTGVGPGVDAGAHAGAGFGVAGESAPDLFTLLAEVAALKNEVKLESRQVKSALDDFRALFDTLRAANDRLADERSLRRDQEGAVLDKAQKDLLLELLDLRDRLQAGHDQAVRFAPGWRTGQAAASFVAAMAEGMAMNLRRLDEALARRGVRPLPALGEIFDPHRMYAAELAHDSKVVDGRVLGELRKGFLHQDKLLRPAEVVVNRRQSESKDSRSAAQREEAYRTRIFFSQWSQV